MVRQTPLIIALCLCSSWLFAQAPAPPTNLRLVTAGGPVQLSANPTSLSFGNVSPGSQRTLSVTLSSVNANVTISNVSVSGTGFSASGVSAGQVLVPGNTATLNVVFAPTTFGSVTGTVTITSSAANSPTTIPLTGAGSSPATILWSADHEEGNMSDWYTASGGGEFNSGTAFSGASTDVAHSGKFSAKGTISTPPSPSAVRLFRWTEGRANPSAYYSAWFYFPQIYTPSWWIIDQFKSRNCSTCDPDPFWFVQARNRADGKMALSLTFWYGPWPGGTVEGPHAGEFGGRDYYQSIKELPTSQWVHIEIFLRQSAAFDGEIVVWQDGVEILRQTNVKTRYPYMGDEWAVSSYSASISPSPATIYFDDAAISTGRLGPGF